MTTVKIREAEATVYVLGRGETQVKGQACFTLDELEWARMIGRSTSDPEETKAFWATLIEKKIAGGAAYSIFQDFPRREPPATERARVAEHYGSAIMETLKAGKARA